MSTDDFETRLRTRLADLADSEDGWADPLPEVRRRAADPDFEAAAPPAVARRRWWPGLAVAATVAALLVGGGFGVRELVRTSGQDSGASAGAAYAGSCATAGRCEDNGSTNGPSAAPGTVGSPSAGASAGGDDTAGCAATGPAASTGTLAGIASIRPSGITKAEASSGGTAGISYQLTFNRADGTVQVRAAQAVWSRDGVLCAAPPGELQSDAIRVVPVEPGAGVSGSATFTAVDSSGNPLPAGDYEVSIVIPYVDPAADSTVPSYLVSPPTSVVVS